MNTHFYRKPLKANKRLETNIQSVVYNAIENNELVTLRAITKSVGEYLLKNPADSIQICPHGRLDLFVKAVESTVKDLVNLGALSELHGAKLDRICP